MNLQQILLIVWARRRTALAVLLLTLALAALVSLVLPRQYIASAALVLDVKNDPIAGALMPGLTSPGYIATQIDIVESERVATRVVKLLRLAQNAKAVENWKAATAEKTPFDHYYGKLLQKGLSIRPTPGSNVLTLAFASSDPQFAAAAANAYAQAYVDVNIELRVEPARQYAAWFDERLKTLRADLERTQSKLSAYQQATGIVAADAPLDHETARLAALTAQLAETEAQKAETLSRLKNTGSELSPDVMANPLIVGIKSDIAKAEARLNEIGSGLGRNHPVHQQAEAQIGGLKQQLAAEIRRISGGAGTLSKATSQKEEELQAAIEAQKQRLLKLRSERDAIAILARDVDSAQRAYDAVAQRITLSNLESQMQQNNVSILSPAIEPDQPARPRVLLNMLAALALGALLGVGAALSLERLDGRVRNPQDLAAAGLPLLGVLQAEKARPAALPGWLAQALARRRRLPRGAPAAEGA